MANLEEQVSFVGCLIYEVGFALATQRGIMGFWFGMRERESEISRGNEREQEISYQVGAGNFERRQKSKLKNKGAKRENFGLYSFCFMAFLQCYENKI